MAFIFKKLDVYRRSVSFVEKVLELTENMPKGYSFLKDQFNRASTSIPLNIAEGNGRWHASERRNFFVIARGSCFECVPILEIMKAEKLVTDQEFKHYSDNLEEIAKMLMGLIKSCGR
jgi:four helix bundle protein